MTGEPDKITLGVTQGRVRERSATERAVERAALLLAKGVAGIVLAGVIYLFLVFLGLSYGFGVEVLRWVDPRVSPLGPWGTLFLMWPLLGLLGVMLQDIGGAILSIARRVLGRT